jgi:hypothetical protein
LDELARWYEKYYCTLSEKYKKNALVYECFKEENLKNKSPEERRILETGIYISTFLKKLLNPNEKDKKALRIARYRSIQHIENTVVQIINDNKDYFSTCKNLNKGCFRVDEFGSKKVREYFKGMIISFFLERYCLFEACKLSKKFFGLKNFKLLEFFLFPRLLGTILGSAILVLTAEELWSFTYNLSKDLPGFICFFFLAVISIILYIALLDMKSIVPELNIGIRLKRALLFVLFIGFPVSFLISYMLVQIQNKYKFLQITQQSSSILDLKFTCLLSAITLLIAIIMNHFWQKETIPKPL